MNLFFVLFHQFTLNTKQLHNIRGHFSKMSLSTVFEPQEEKRQQLSNVIQAALNEAAVKSDVEAIRRLVKECGANANRSDQTNGWTSLHYATVYGDVTF